ncbi:MAG TPA: ATP-dependent sacrificial sulfur transferase LarE, partial [Candidatus Dormibacteraeota bacterium]
TQRSGGRDLEPGLLALWDAASAADLLRATAAAAFLCAAATRGAACGASALGAAGRGAAAAQRATAGDLIQVDSLDRAKVDRARALVRDLGSVLVAYSGGVDSTLLLKLALDELRDGAVAVLATSPAYPPAEQEEARALAGQLGARLIEVDTREVELDAYRRNGADRCFHCKEELFETLEPLRAELGLAHLAYGANADDGGDHRPGHASAERRGVRFPLLEAGLTKAEIRATARRLGLSNWDKPSFACLSSRVPFGTEISEAVLQQVAAAEAAVHALGFRQVRVRHHGDVARIEVEAEDQDRLLEQRAEVARGVRAAGYRFVSLDLEPYETGRLSRRR